MHQQFFPFPALAHNASAIPHADSTTDGTFNKMKRQLGDDQGLSDVKIKTPKVESEDEDLDDAELLFSADSVGKDEDLDIKEEASDEDRSINESDEDSGCDVKDERDLQPRDSNLHGNQEILESPESLKRCRVVLERDHQTDEAKEAMLRRTLPSLHLRGVPGKTAFCYHRVGENHVTSDVVDICKFSCLKCGHLFLNGRRLRRHLLACAGVDLSSAGKGFSVVEARYHACRLCQDRVLCDRVFIAQHARAKHATTFKDYENLPPERYFQMHSTRILRLMREYPPSQYRPSRRKKPSLSLSVLEKHKVEPGSVCQEVENLCTYRCDLCGGVFKTGFSMFQYGHLKYCNQGETKLKSEYCHEVRYHDCRLCGKRMFCDLKVLSHHVKEVHGLTIDKYRLEEAREQVAQDFDANKNYILPKAANAVGSFPDELLSNTLGDFCLFGCEVCSFVTTNWNLMREHNKKSPHGTDSCAFLPSQVKKAIYHKCILCQRIVYCDQFLIWTHSYKCHGIRFKPYKQMVMEKFNLTEESTSGNEDSKAALQEDELFKQKVKPIPCDKYFTRYVLLSDLVPRQFTTDHIGNLCTFSCVECPFRATSWDVMGKHFRAIHHSERLPKNLTRRERPSSNGFERRFVSEGRMHWCKLCHKAVYCDVNLILRHLQITHRITSLAVYKEHETLGSISPARQDNQDKKGEKRVSRLEVYQKKRAGVEVAYTESLSHMSCKECGFSAETYHEVRGHIMATRHGLKEDQRLHYKVIKPCILHECQVCHKKINCGGGGPREHVMREHGFEGLADYVRQTQKSRE